MIILLEIDGWQKSIEIPNRVWRRGFIDMPHTIPPALLSDQGAEARSEYRIVYRFYFQGQYSLGVPVFKWDAQ